MLKTGCFIVVEGLEGAGKTTAITTIKTYLDNLTSDIFITREPGSTFVGERIRGLIKSPPGGEPLDSLCELLLLYAARRQLLTRLIWPKLKQGITVISDRFELSSYAYQCGGRQLSQSCLDKLSALCLQEFEPDLTLFLDISPEQGLERVRLRGEKDCIEQESLDFFKRVYDSYHHCIKSMNNVCIIDASQSQITVQQAIINTLTNFFKSTKVYK